MKIKWKKVFAFVVLILFSLISIGPIIHVVGVSFRADQSFAVRDVFSGEWNWNNYIQLFTKTDFLLWVKNSTYVSFVVTLTGVVLASMSGYSLSRFRFVGRGALMLSLLVTQMFPATMLLLPFFIVLTKLKLINSFFGLFLIYSSTALPFCIWQMKGFFDTLPREIEEAARVDGCSWFQTWFRIVLPLSTPAMVITALFSFMASWSEYVVAAIVLQNPELYTLPIGLKSFQASLSTQWGFYAAGAVVVSLPVVVLFVTLSRYLVSGLTVGGVKG